MVRCGRHYGVRIDGHLTWFDDYAEAAAVETRELYDKVKQKLEAGQRVILTTDMWRQVEKARCAHKAEQD